LFTLNRKKMFAILRDVYPVKKVSTNRVCDQEEYYLKKCPVAVIYI
jgi:hypothetical protein